MTSVIENKPKKEYTKDPNNWNICPTCGKLTRATFCINHRYKNKMRPCGYQISDTEVCQVLTSTGQCRKHNFNYRKPCAKVGCKRMCRNKESLCWKHKQGKKNAIINDSEIKGSNAIINDSE